MSIFCSHNGRLINAQNINDGNVDEFKDWSLQLRCCGEKAVLSKSRNGNYFFAHASMRKVACPWKEVSDEHRFLVSAAHDYLVGQKGFSIIPEYLIDGGDHKVCVDLMCQHGDQEERIAFVFETASLSKRGGVEAILKEDDTLKKMGVSRVFWILPDRWKLENESIDAVSYPRDTDDRNRALDALKLIISRHFPVEADLDKPVPHSVTEFNDEKSGFPLFQAQRPNPTIPDDISNPGGSIFREYQKALVSSVGGPLQREARLYEILKQHGDSLGLNPLTWATKPCSFLERHRPVDMALGGACSYIEVMKYLAELEAQ